jgi:hypothetical protein
VIVWGCSAPIARVPLGLPQLAGQVLQDAQVVDRRERHVVVGAEPLPPDRERFDQQ